MNIVVTGTREGMTAAQKGTVEKMLSGLYILKTVMHNGLCVGADADFHAIATRLGIEVVGHPAFEVGNRWRVDLPCAELRDVSAPFVRDRVMVEQSIMCIATPKEATEQTKGGTWYTLHYAQKMGLAWFIVWPNGEVQFEYKGDRAHPDKHQQSILELR